MFRDPTAGVTGRNNPLLPLQCTPVRVLTAALAAGLLIAFAAAPAWALDAGKTAAGCADCHGKDGSSSENDVPTIAGQSAEYLAGTMAAYRDKTRPCPQSSYRAGPKKDTKTTMCEISKGMSDADLKQLADYFAARPFVRTPQKFDAELVAKGKELHDKLCEKCHSEGGTQSADNSGVLAGQRSGYLTASMAEFRSGERKPPQKMKPKLDKVDDAAAAALIAYYASFK